MVIVSSSSILQLASALLRQLRHHWQERTSMETLQLALALGSLSAHGILERCRHGLRSFSTLVQSAVQNGTSYCPLPYVVMTGVGYW